MPLKYRVGAEGKNRLLSSVYAVHGRPFPLSTKEIDLRSMGIRAEAGLVSFIDPVGAVHRCFVNMSGNVSGHTDPRLVCTRQLHAVCNFL